MKKQLFLLVLLLFAFARLQAGNIVAAEYFWDIDPGIGLATAMSIAAGDPVNVSSSIPATGLSPGNHVFYIRTKDNNSHWSLSEGRTVTVIAPEIDVTGNAVTIPDGSTTTSLNDLTDFGNVFLCSSLTRTFTIQNTGNADLNIGNIFKVHTNSNFLISNFPSVIAAGSSAIFTITFTPTVLGPSSVAIAISDNDPDEANYTFAVRGTGIACPAIVAAEYFWDTDPGVGLGTVINFASGDPVNINSSVTTSALKTGIHKFYIRTEDNNSHWSLSEGRPVTVLAKIVAAEYFWDTDPGVGLATALASFTPSDLVNVSSSVPATGLSPGNHVLYIRTKDNNSHWSLSEPRTVTVIAPEINVTGNAVTIANGDITPTTTDLTDFGNVSLCGSLTRTFNIQNTGNADLNISNILLSHVDPKFIISNIPSVITAGSSANFTITFLPAGFGSSAIGVIIQSNDPDEALYNFSISATEIPCPAIVAAEYFWDTDPGIGLATVISVTSGDPVNINSSAATSGLTTGNHKFYIRTEDNNGHWSLSEGRSVTIVAKIVAAEYFWDTDQGIGLATTLASFTPSDLVNVSSSIPSTGLSPGNHVFYIRTKDNNSHWSLSEGRTVNVLVAPTITCPGNQFATFNNTTCSAIVDYSVSSTGVPAPSYSFVFTGATIASGSGTGSGSSFNPGVTTVTITASNGTVPATCSFTVFVTATGPEINVSGNGVSIPDGAVTPSLTNLTDFGSVNTGGIITRIFSIDNFLGATGLHIAGITISGSDSSSFVVNRLSTSIIGNLAASNLAIMFIPNTPGIKTATVHIANDDCNEGDYDFVIEGTATGTVSSGQIVAAEYFIDTIPSSGVGTTIPVTQSDSITLNNFSLPLAGIAPGLHNLYVRAKTSNDVWTVIEQRPFFIINTFTNNTQVEYFIDTITATGTGTNVPVIAADTITLSNVSVLLTGKTVGIHNLYFRVKAGNNLWSVIEQRPFYILNNYTTNTAVEYFIDSIPFAGVGATIPVTAGDTITLTNTIIPLTGVATGLHNLYVRAKTSNDVWNVIDQRPFYVFGNGDVTEITKLEYFFDGPDPGVGSAINLDISYLPPNDTVILNINKRAPCLSTGQHFMYLRAKNNLGVWSVIDYDTLNINSSSFTAVPITPAGPVSLCDSAAVILQADSATGITYQWQDGGVPLSGQTYATYMTSSPGNYSLKQTCPVNAGFVVSNEVSVLACDNMISLTIRVFIEGFYAGNSTMRPVIDPINLPGICDTLVMQLYDSLDVHSAATSVTGIVNTSGYADFLFNQSMLIPLHKYYIVIRHRNSLETWSKNPVVIFNNLTFDFTNKF